MPIPEEIRARRGKEVLPVWDALLKEIDRTDVVIGGGGVRVRRMPDATYVYADKPIAPWPHPFRVIANAEGASVREGTVNTISPYIDGVPISGIDEEGEAVEVPRVEIKHNGEPRTYIALMVKAVDEGRGLAVQDTPDSLWIEHVASLDDATLNEGGATETGEGIAAYPLAVLYWQAKGVLRRTFQIVHHNLNHRYAEADFAAGRPARHFFWAS